MLERMVIEHCIGKDKVTASPFMLSINPVYNLISTIKDYKKQFAGKKVLYIPHIPAHGNLQSSSLGSRGYFSPDALIDELDQLKIDAGLISKHHAVKADLERLVVEE